MSEILYRFGQSPPVQKVAAPVMRITAITDPVSGAELAAPVYELLRHFLDRFGADVGFTARSKTKGPARPVTLGKVTPKRLDGIFQTVREGGLESYGVRLYGTDETDYGQPLAPYASVAHHFAETDSEGLVEYAQIDVAVPHDSPETEMFLRKSDTLLRKLPLRMGFQGLGFATSPVRSAGSSQDMLPPAFQRFRAAIMTGWHVPASLVYHNRNSTTFLGDYNAGLTDMGWRTYVGGEFAARLEGAPDSPDVTVEHAGRTLIVTAGARPVWGDVEAGEEIAAYRSAYRYLEAAFASRDRRLREAPCPERWYAEVLTYREAYLDRFA